MMGLHQIALTLNPPTHTHTHKMKNELTLDQEVRALQMTTYKVAENIDVKLIFSRWARFKLWLRMRLKK